MSENEGICLNGITRKAHIIDELERSGTIDVAKLATQFSVSKVTVRRDLNELVKEHIVRRTHGGAVLNEDYIAQQRDFPYRVRGVQHHDEKKRICKLATEFIQPNDVLFIDNSSTLQYLPRFLSPSMTLTILTNSIGLLSEASRLNCSSHTYVCLGGIFNRGNHSTFGQLALMNAKDFFPAKALMSCASISSAGIVTDSSILELEVKAFMLRQSRECFLLADSSKFDVLDKIYLCHLSAFAHLLTDEKTDISQFSANALSSLQIHIAK